MDTSPGCDSVESHGWDFHPGYFKELHGWDIHPGYFNESHSCFN